MPDVSARSNVKVGYVIHSGRCTGNLQQTALDLITAITPLFGDSARLRLLETSASVALPFVCKQLQLLHVPMTAERQKQADLAFAQAATLSGSIALSNGEQPTGPFFDS